MSFLILSIEFFLSLFFSRIDGEVTLLKEVLSKKSKPVSDLTDFVVCHTLDQMGPAGYNGVMTTDATQRGNITKTLNAIQHNNGEKIIDTYIWRAKKIEKDSQVYDVDVVYGENTNPPPGYQKCEKTLTPQCDSNSKAYLCYRTINEDDHAMIQKRANEMGVTSCSSYETKMVEEEKTTSLKTDSPAIEFGKVLKLETLGLLTSIVSTPSSMFNNHFSNNFVNDFVNKVFTRLNTMSDDELNSFDTKILSNVTLPGLIELQVVCDSLQVTSTGGSNLSYGTNESSMIIALKKFQLALTRKFLTCGYLQKRLLGVDMLMEWIRCARINDSKKSNSITSSSKEEEHKKKDDTDSDDSNDSMDHNRRRGGGSRRGGVYHYGGGVGYSVAAGGRYNNPIYNHGYNNYNNQLSSDEEEEDVPKHAEWISVSELLQWMEDNSIIEVLLMGNKHLCDRAKKLHAMNPTKKTENMIKIEHFPGVTGHPQVAKKAFQYNKKLKTSLIKFLSCPNKEKIMENQGYGGLTPKVLDVIWLGVRGNNMNVSAADTIIGALRKSTRSLPVDSFKYFVSKYFSDSSFGDPNSSFQVRESIIKLISSFSKRSYKRYEMLQQSGNDTDSSDSDATKEEKKKKDKNIFEEICANRELWINCLDRLFELCFPTTNACSEIIQCSDISVRGVCDGNFLEAVDMWDSDQSMVERYLIKMIVLLQKINTTKKQSINYKEIQLDACRSLSGLQSKVYDLYTSKTNPELLPEKVFELLLSLCESSINIDILSSLITFASRISYASNSPNPNDPNIVDLTSKRLKQLHTHLLKMDQEEEGRDNSRDNSRTGILWKWIQFSVSFTDDIDIDNKPIIIKSDELIKMYNDLIIPSMNNRSMQGSCKLDSSNLSSLYWSALKKVNVESNKIKINGKKTSYLGFNELDGIDCVWSFLSNETNDTTALLMMSRIVRALLNQHGSLKSNPFDTSAKAIVWKNFIHRIHIETKKLVNDIGARKSSVKYLIQMFRKFMIESQNVKLEYDENMPEMLVGSTVWVTWCHNKNYHGEITEYMTDGENQGKHRVIYDDNDIKFYKIRLEPNTYGSGNELVAPNNDNETDIHIFHIDKWNPSVAAPPELENEKTYAIRCALGQFQYETKDNDNNEQEDYFTCLFNLLSTKDVERDVMHNVWKLINLLPKHPKRQLLLTNCMKGDDWSTIIQSKSPLQLFYSIQLIQQQLIDAPEWSVQFIDSGGFDYLVNTLLKMDITLLVQDPLSRECVYTMITLFQHFLKKSLIMDHDQKLYFSISNNGFSDLISHLLKHLLIILRVIGKEAKEELQELEDEKSSNNLTKSRRSRRDAGNVSKSKNMKEKEREKEKELRHQRDSKVIGIIITTLATLCSRDDSSNEFNSKRAILSFIEFNQLEELLRIGCIDMARNTVRVQISMCIQNICKIATDKADYSNIWSFFVGILLRVGMDPKEMTLLQHQSTSKEYLTLLSTILLGGTQANVLQRELLLDVINVSANVLMKNQALKDGMLIGLFTCLRQSIGCISTATAEGSGETDIEENNKLFDSLSTYIISSCLFPTETTTEESKVKDGKEILTINSPT